MPALPVANHRGPTRFTPLVCIVAALFAVLFASPSCKHEASGGGLARVRRAGVLRWGGDIQGGEPYVYEDPHNPGRLIGFEVDLANSVARELGVRAEFVQNDWSNLVPSLDRGTFDVAMNGLEVTPARAARVLFTRPYYAFGLRLMARRDDARITTDLTSVRGLRVGTLANSQAWDRLLRTGATPVPYEGVEEPYADLEQRRTDAVLLDDIIADRYGVPKPALRVVGDVGEGYYSIAVRKSEPELHAALDTALQRIAHTGELRRILDRWHIDGDRQAQFTNWTDLQTHQLTAVTEETHLDRGRVWLFFQGAFVTLLISVGAMALAIPLGMLFALGKMYAPPGVRHFCAMYVEVFRGTPVLLQLYVIYYGLAGTPLQLGPYAAAVVGLGMNYAAYEAEVYCAGIQAVPKGQMEAAVSLGMSTGLALRRVIMPQAFRMALPSVTNDFIALLKDSSLVSVITVVELTKRMTITAVETRSWLLPGALCAALYFAMGYPLSRLSRRLEEKLARS